jgi:threonyl-tRNA synthetase
MLVTGDREAAEGTVSVRGRVAGDLGARPVDAFIADALDEIRTKALQLPAPAEQQPA